MALSLKVDSLLAFQVNWTKISIQVETMEGHQASQEVRKMMGVSMALETVYNDFK